MIPQIGRTFSRKLPPCLSWNIIDSDTILFGFLQMVVWSIAMGTDDTW